jgi:hypothetical protein
VAGVDSRIAALVGHRNPPDQDPDQHQPDALV